MSRVLDEILRSKRAELSRLRSRSVGHHVEHRPTPGRVVEALVRREPAGPVRLVAEIKLRSPSAGPLSTTLSVGDRAVAYARAGAAMISVLCDGPFFGGGFEHLALARAALVEAGLDTPLLAKEFVLDERQVDEAASWGADAVLLVVRIVERERLVRLVAHARTLGIEPLVEIVTDDELAVALDADAKVIGVNARDLDTLALDGERAARVLANVPPDRITVRLSGLGGPRDVDAVRSSGVDAALIGEILMRQDDPTTVLASMVAAARG